MGAGRVFSKMHERIFLGKATATEDYKEMLFQALLQTGYAIIFWALGGIANVYYSRHES